MPSRRLSLALFALTIAAGGEARAIDLKFGTDLKPGGSTATFTETTVNRAATPGFVGATVLSAVNVRSAPSSIDSRVTGTLRGGEHVEVKCRLGWCQLDQTGGFVAQKFLSLDDSAQSIEAVPAPSAAEAISDASSSPPDAKTADLPNFDGTWTPIDAYGKPGQAMILTQSGATVTGTIQAPDRLTKLSGDISGKTLDFTYVMLNGAGKQIANGSGYLTITADGSALNGALMLNGLVMGNLKATR